MLNALMQISKLLFSQRIVAAFSPSLMKVVGALEEENGTYLFREKSDEFAPQKNSKQAPVDASVVH